MGYFLPHFTQGKPKVEKLSDLPKIIVGVRVRTEFRISEGPSLCPELRLLDRASPSSSKMGCSAEHAVSLAIKHDLGTRGRGNTSS